MGQAPGRGGKGTDEAETGLFRPSRLAAHPQMGEHHAIGQDPTRRVGPRFGVARESAVHSLACPWPMLQRGRIPPQSRVLSS